MVSAFQSFAFDLFPSRFIFTLDDSSGETIEITCERPKATLPTEDTHELSRTLALPETSTKGITAKGGEVDLAGVDVGTVVKVKGGIRDWRGGRQVSLERISIIHTTNEESVAWTENVAFRKDVLGKPWCLEEKEEKRAKRKAGGRDREEKIRMVKVRGKPKNLYSRNPVQKMCKDETEERRCIEKENVRKKDRLDREKEREKLELERLEREKELDRRRLEIEAVTEREEVELQKERKKAELHRQREMDKQQHQTVQAEKEREQARKRRDADRAERERAFAERMGAPWQDGRSGIRKQNRKERRTDHF
ncbi:MAG: hypothetical protein Q9217_005969 [Psora testacea]